MNERDQRIVDVIRSLREGEVVTYGDIAEDAGYPKLSRLVGRILATTDRRTAVVASRQLGWAAGAGPRA